MSRVCRMPPKKRKVPGGNQQQRRVKALRQAVRDARAARRAREVEERASVHGLD